MISEETRHRLESLQEAFLRENAKINLSAFRTPESCWTGNILDSLAALETAPLHNRPQNLRILELGTGGGFPLLPLAICLPQCACVGLDSVQKKIAAVQRIVDALQLPNVRLECGRSETLARESTHREQYDIVLCRGVAELNALLELAAPFAKVGGCVFCWKSLSIEQELQDSLLARAELSCQMENPYVYDLGGTWGRRQILVFRKRAKTAAKYPREVGEPKKHPLR